MKFELFSDTHVLWFRKQFAIKHAFSPFSFQLGLGLEVLHLIYGSWAFVMCEFRELS